MREELAHVDQYREGLVGEIDTNGLTNEREMEIDARERMLADPWGLTGRQLRDIQQEIDDLRSGRRVK